MGLRNRFQMFVFEKMNIGYDVDQVLKIGKIISDYIDNPENTVERDLIRQEKFTEAAEMMIVEIRRVEEETKESLKKAA